MHGKHRSILVKFSLSFFAPWFIVVLVCGFSLVYAVRYAMQTAMTNERILLAHAKESINAELQSARAMADEINEGNIGQALSECIRQSSGTGSVYDMYLALKSMPGLPAGSGLIQQYYVYSWKNGCIYADGYGVTDLTRYYTTFIWFEEKTLDAWRTDILESTDYYRLLEAGTLVQKCSAPIQASGTLPKIRTLCYLVPYLSRYSGKVIGNIVFYIDADALLRQITTISEASSVYLLDDAGNLLASRLPDGSEAADGGFLLTPDAGLWANNGQKCVVSSSTSQYGFAMYVATPVSFFVTQALFALRWVLAAAAVIILFSTFLTLRLLNANLKPLVGIVDSMNWDLNRRRVFRNGLWFLKGAFDELETSNTSMRQMVNSQRQQMRGMLIQRLVSSGLPEEAERTQLAQMMDIPKGPVRFRGVLLETEGTGCSLEQEYVALEKLEGEYPGCLRLLTMVAPGRWLLLYMERAGATSEEMIELLGTLRANLLRQYSMRAIMFVGFSCVDLASVNRSFKSALELSANAGDFAGRFILCADAFGGPRSDYAYTLEDERKLVNLIYSYDYDAIAKMLKDIYRWNFVDVQLDDFARRLLYARLVSTPYNADHRLLLPEEMKNTLYDLPADQFFEQMRIFCTQTACAIEDRTKRRNDDVVAKMTVYLKENFSDPNLCLSCMAAHFGFSESYLSVLFKNAVGETYSVFVERLRIEKSQKLLDEGAVTVEEIASRVGYTCVSTFRRAYKRVKGCTPAQHRGRSTFE